MVSLACGSGLSLCSRSGTCFPSRHYWLIALLNISGLRPLFVVPLACGFITVSQTFYYLIFSPLINSFSYIRDYATGSLRPQCHGTASRALAFRLPNPDCSPALLYTPGVSLRLRLASAVMTNALPGQLVRPETLDQVCVTTSLLSLFDSASTKRGDIANHDKLFGVRDSQQRQLFEFLDHLVYCSIGTSNSFAFGRSQANWVCGMAIRCAT